MFCARRGRDRSGNAEDQAILGFVTGKKILDEVLKCDRIIEIADLHRNSTFWRSTFT